MMKTFVLHPDVNLYAYFKFSSNDLQMATYDEMTSGDGLFNMIESHPDNVIALFDGMIASELDADISLRMGSLKNICITYANQDEASQPAPQPITPTCKSITWSQGQDIVVDVKESIPEGASVTTWLVKDGFADENMGRSTYVNEALKYTIRLADKRGQGDIEVRVNCESALFDLEVI